MSPHTNKTPQEVLDMCIGLEHPWCSNDELIECIRWMATQINEPEKGM